MNEDGVVVKNFEIKHVKHDVRVFIRAFLLWRNMEFKHRKI